MKTLTGSLAAMFCAVMAAAPASAERDTARYTTLTVFGDSLVDAGNVSLLSGGTIPNPADGYFQGRFTNGYDYTDLISLELFGTPTTPSFVPGGRNFAFGGARATPTSGVPDLQEQLGLFAASGQAIDENGLYVLNFGGNDVFAVANGEVSAANASAFLMDAAARYAGAVQTLNDLGARNILITGFPVLTSAYSFEAQGYLNSDLDALTLDADTDLFRFSYLDFFQTVLTNPAAVGLPALDPNPANNCVALGQQANGCAGLFFFDSVHPTAAVQEALFNEIDRQFAVTASVPEPATWGMMILGFGLVGAAVRRRPAHAAA